MAAAAGPWVVLGRTARLRWGGDLRRAHIFARLATRTAAVSTPRWDARAAFGALRRTPGALRPWEPRPWLASSELLTPNALRLAGILARPAALDVHDQPIIQAAALGRPLEPRVARALGSRVARNLALFPIHVVPSASFADLAGLDPGRVIVAPNGADTAHVRPGPFPDRPTIGLVSGAAPNRGIEVVVETARLLRSTVPELRLRLWLAGTDAAGLAYVEQLRVALEPASWAEVRAVPYSDLGAALAEATVLVVPHPANPYLDVAVPVKLLDSMAAGRPVVVTPRLEAARIVEAASCGRISAGDDAPALAEAIAPLLADPALAAELGRN
ncbi:MAG TPA: glycosyltransferase family 4 protein, partial [Candidatus Limnocylindrales bacterium]|nr:glycosyltransferase family 4 protein [Candidatus Limnocylindrales bacterium]